MEVWMKALTCAGYEYMKLMVAELQRQLDEIEDTKGKFICHENIIRKHFDTHRQNRISAKKEKKRKLDKIITFSLNNKWKR